ncbi:ImmA/IrrE family metallo-endopeptidase [Cryobacterium sp. TMT2-23]|uniref:ImmA/IrrE family metallo-endopeptidase n=1 Tax=Cryobacterium sp. TMT2-23 TaxID=1259252 RepID=UPI00106C995B|nr:ImmA/IrrE family metallo-endopeptidase [Cryobacterium sp. TMT2-23]TFD20831.1 ImmA/IrrE family metallo-endopeptidase [Cryobacterium sp. TMT2-23]
MTLSVEQQAKQAADEFRRNHRLGVQPLGDLVAFIEQTTGYDVAILDAEPDEHGLAMCDPVRGAVFVGVARSRNPMRQRSTLAHELGHLVFEGWNDEAEFEKRSPDEIRADAFARHLLIPIEGVKEFLGDRESASEADLAAVVQRYLVSPAIAAIAMRDAGYINQSTAQDWMRYRTPQIATRYGWSDHYAALQDDSDRLRAPQSLVARAVEGYAEGIVSAQVIATLRGVSVDAVLEDLEEAGVVPVQHEATDLSLEDFPDVDVDLSDLEDEGASP